MATKAKTKSKEKDKASALIDQARYRCFKVKNESNRQRVSAGCGDAIHKVLIGCTLSDLVKIAKDNGLTDKFKREYPNAGMARMALGNMLRPLVKKKQPVVVGDVTVRSLSQSVPVKDLVEGKRKASVGKSA